MKNIFWGLKMNGLKCSKEQRFRLAANICISFVLYALLTLLFYRQAWEYEGRYWSDLPWHIRAGIDGGDYSFLYFMIGTIYRLTGSYFWIASFESSLVILAFLASEEYLYRSLKVSGKWAVCISAGAIFLCSLYVPLLYPYCYPGSLLTQPWHNITYLGMRLFSIPVFFHTLHILESYRNRFTWKDWLIIAAPLLLCTSIKPNFLAGYSMALLCILIADFAGDLFKKELSVSSFFRYISLGSTVFPAVLILFYQMFILYGEQNGVASESGMTLLLWSSQFFEQGIMTAIIGVIRDLAFPLLVTAYGYKCFSKKDKFVWLLFLITLIQRIVLEETGPRAGDGNFTWAIYNVGYLLFLYMVPKFIQLVRMVPWGQKGLREKCFTWAGTILLCMHLFFGLRYFLIVLSGEIYYI